jgi:hypothetical protein
VRRGDRVATLAAARVRVRGAPKDEEEGRSHRPEEQEERRNREEEALTHDRLAPIWLS